MGQYQAKAEPVFDKIGQLAEQHITDDNVKAAMKDSLVAVRQAFLNMDESLEKVRQGATFEEAGMALGPDSRELVEAGLEENRAELVAGLKSDFGEVSDAIHQEVEKEAHALCDIMRDVKHEIDKLLKDEAQKASSSEA